MTAITRTVTSPGRGAGQSPTRGNARGLGPSQVLLGTHQGCKSRYYRTWYIAGGFGRASRGINNTKNRFRANPPLASWHKPAGLTRPALCWVQHDNMEVDSIAPGKNGQKQQQNTHTNDQTLCHPCLLPNTRPQSSTTDARASTLPMGRPRHQTNSQQTDQASRLRQAMKMESTRNKCLIDSGRYDGTCVYLDILT